MAPLCSSGRCRDPWEQSKLLFCRGTQPAVSSSRPPAPSASLASPRVQSELLQGWHLGACRLESQRQRHPRSLPQAAESLMEARGWPLGVGPHSLRSGKSSAGPQQQEDCPARLSNRVRTLARPACQLLASQVASCPDCSQTSPQPVPAAVRSQHSCGIRCPSAWPLTSA